MQVVLLSLVIEGREVLLADESRQAVGGGDVSGREGSESGHVQRFGLTHAGNLLTVAIHQADDARVRLLAELLNQIPDVQKVFFMQDDIGGGQSRLPKKRG